MGVWAEMVCGGMTADWVRGGWGWAGEAWDCCERMFWSCDWIWLKICWLCPKQKEKERSCRGSWA